MGNSIYRVSFLFAIIFGVLQFSCYQSPDDILFGIDSCEDCGTLITDSRYGAELIRSDGKTYKFDTIECILNFTIKNKFEREEIKSKWVIDYSNPGELVYVLSATFVHANNIKNSVQTNFIAFSDDSEAQKLADSIGGELISFKDVVEKFQDKKVVAQLF